MKRAILVVEDNPLNSELFSSWLEMEGHEALVVDCLEAARAALASRVPDLILLDVALGADDGLDLLPWMRGNQALRHIPVVAVSAHALLPHQQRMQQAGCVATISKPVDFDLLRKEMQRWLPLEKEE